jgi:uncharacterized protein with von Willebrand factor type A (vWA) domain
LFGPSSPVASRSAIIHDPFDEEAFEEILLKATGLRLVLGESEIPAARELAFDLFCSFYKYFVKLRSPVEIAPECQGNRDLLERALALREHEKLRAFTRLKPAETSLATELVLDALLKELKQRPLTPPPDSTAPTDPTDSQLSDSAASASTERLRGVLRDAHEDLQGVAELVAAWSSGPGQETRLPSELKLRLMREVVRNPRLRMIALLFGRYRRLGLRKRTLPALRASQEVVDFVQGGDVARALAGELSSFAMEEREDLFYAKVVTRSLMIYELWRREEEPRAVYMCIDNSGSMAGDKEVWAKASALALAHLALAEGRPVEVVLFGDEADPLRVVSIRPDDDASTRMEKVLDIASYFLGGGTDFVKPLAHVLDTIAMEDRKGNDLLFVSDGLCPIPEEFIKTFREAKTRYDLRVTSVLIGEDPFSLREISDELHRLDEALEAGETLAAHFASAFLERTAEPTRTVRAPLRPGRGTPLLFDHFLPEAEEQ